MDKVFASGIIIIGLTKFALPFLLAGWFLNYLISG